MAAYSPEIIKTLNDQVQTLAPLRDSYQKLQAYYHQLTRDVSILVTQTVFIFRLRANPNPTFCRTSTISKKCITPSKDSSTVVGNN